MARLTDADAIAAGAARAVEAAVAAGLGATITDPAVIERVAQLLSSEAR